MDFFSSGSCSEDKFINCTTVSVVYKIIHRKLNMGLCAISVGLLCGDFNVFI